MWVIEIGLLSAGLTLFINYCIGKPGLEFSPYEIFSFYTVWLSKRRLKNVGLYKIYEQQYTENLTRLKDRHEILNLKKDFKIMLYNTAEPFFTWERAFGMCSICNNFWVTLFSGLIFTQNALYLLSIVVISHIAIRILNKLL